MLAQLPRSQRVEQSQLTVPVVHDRNEDSCERRVLRRLCGYFGRGVTHLLDAQRPVAIVAERFFGKGEGSGRGATAAQRTAHNIPRPQHFEADAKVFSL